MADLGSTKALGSRSAMLAALFAVAAVFTTVVVAYGQDLVGTPLNTNRNFELGADLGFGHRFSPSLGINYQDWGAQIVQKSDGFPVRLGQQSIRFETRESFCGWDDGWSDCAQGRSRHELSTSSDRDPADTDLWFSLSFYLPEGYDLPNSIGNSIFQLWSGGRDSFQFKFKSGSGFTAQRKLDEVETILLPERDLRGRWIDVLMLVRHSMGDRGQLQMWVNGKKAYDYSGRTIAGTDPSAPNYFKFGIYNTAFNANGAPVGPDGNANGEGLPNLHLFFDEVRFARDCAELNLADLGYDCDDFSYAGADREQVSALQSALNALGCDVGAVDGLIGRRTIEAAFACRQFAPGQMPDTLSASSIPDFVALYTDAAERGLPEQPRIIISRAHSEIVGGNNDNALDIAAQGDDNELDIILIGHFDPTGNTDWLSILFRDNLSAAEVETALQCPRVTIQTWGDGSNHAEIQFDRGSGGIWTLRDPDCLTRQLPPRTTAQLGFVLQNLEVVAQKVVASGYDGEPHEGLTSFLTSIASGDQAVTGL